MSTPGSTKLGSTSAASDHWVGLISELASFSTAKLSEKITPLFFSMPRSKVSKVLSIGKPRPFGISGDWKF